MHALVGSPGGIGRLIRARGNHGFGILHFVCSHQVTAVVFVIVLYHGLYWSSPGTVLHGRVLRNRSLVFHTSLAISGV
jgi:hypothetical protein